MEKRLSPLKEKQYQTIGLHQLRKEMGEIIDATPYRNDRIISSESHHITDDAIGERKPFELSGIKLKELSSLL